MAEDTPLNSFLFFFAQLFERIKAMPFNQKILVGTLIVTLVFAGVFFWNQTSNDYDVLYSNLSLPDAAAAVAKLKANKTSYKLADGGTTILVPRQQKNQLVLETANELTGEQTVSLGKIPPVLQGDIQDEWIRKLNTDAIAEAIKSVQGIKYAHVIVSEPKETVFAEEKTPPTASVMLIVDPGFRLNENHVKTIKNLVVHAVSGMTPDNVTIADNYGNSLEAGSMGMAANGGLTFQDQRRRLTEEHLRKKITTMLEPLVGKENAVVSVACQMNFDESQSNVRKVLPAELAPDKPAGAGAGGDTTVAVNPNANTKPPTGVVLSEQEQVEEYSGKKPQGPGGEPGVASNVLPSYQQQDAQAQGKEDEKDYRFQKKTVNYAESREERTTIHAPGVVERITVGVMLNRVLTTKERDELKELIANAAGLDTNRGDSVDVKGFQFTSEANAAQKEYLKLYQQSQTQNLILNLLYALVLLALGGAALYTAYRLLGRGEWTVDAIWHNLDSPPVPASQLPPGGKLLPPSPSGKMVYQTADGALIPVVPPSVAADALGALGAGDVPSYGAILPPGMGGDDDMTGAGGLSPSESLLKMLPATDPDIEFIKSSLREIIEQDPEDAARMLLGYMREYD